MAAKLRRLTLQQYEEKTAQSASASLFVLNTTKSPRGEILFNVMGEGNNRICAKVPSTFIPVDLTQTVSRKNLLECSEFKTHLSRGRLVIVESESVEQYMASSQRAQAEYSNIYGTEYLVNDEIDLDGAEANEEEEFEIESGVTNNDLEFPEAEEVLVLVTSGEEDRAYDLLNSRGMDMSADALNYLANKTTSTKIKDLVAEILEEFEA